MSDYRTVSPAAILAAIVAVLLVALAAILFVSNDDAGAQRLALFLPFISLTIVALVAMLRGDVAANRLNGELDQRLAAAVLRANYVRRASDVTPPEAAPVGRDAIDNPTTLGPAAGAPDEGLITD